MRKRLFLLSVFGFIFVIAHVSQSLAGERVISLREALDYSMKGNPELRAAAEGLSAVKEDVGIARSLLLPKLSFEERFMRTNNPTYAFMAKLNEGRFSSQDFAINSLNNPSALNDFQTSLSFEQALFAPGALIGLAMAKKEFDARSSEFGRKREEIAFRVFKAYLGVQTAKAFVTAAEKGIEDANEHVRIAEERFKAELGLLADTLRATVARASAEGRAVSARKNLNVAKRELGLVLGMIESVEVEAGRPAFEVKGLDYYDEMSRSRKDVKVLETKHENAANTLKMATAGYLPVVGIGAGYQMNDHSKPLGAEGDSWQLAAFLRWELFDGARREHERSKARYKIAESGEYLNGYRNSVSFSVYSAYLSVEEARQGLELANAALRSAEEGKRLVKVRYENSLSPIIDLLDVQASLDSARADVIEKEAAYLTAVANLDFQSGVILKDLGVEK